MTTSTARFHGLATLCLLASGCTELTCELTRSLDSESPAEVEAEPESAAEPLGDEAAPSNAGDDGHDDSMPRVLTLAGETVATVQHVKI